MVSAEVHHGGEEPAQEQSDRSVDHARVRGGHGRSAVKASTSPRRPSPTAALYMSLSRIRGSRSIGTGYAGI